MKRRSVLAGLGLAGIGGLAAPAIIRPALGATVVGVTKTEIKIGHFIPYSGNASSYGVGGRSHTAFFKTVERPGRRERPQDRLHLAGRRVQPGQRSVEQTRRLVEQDQVACLFNPLGTPTNSAIHKYMNQKKVPHLFVATSAEKWGDPKNFPWTIGYAPSYRTEAQIYAKYVLEEAAGRQGDAHLPERRFRQGLPAGRAGHLRQGFRQDLREGRDLRFSDATVDSQVVTMKETGADVLVSACIPKFGAQVIRKAFDIGWKPLHMMSNVSASIASTFTPAGPEKGAGIITSRLPEGPDRPGVAERRRHKEWREFMAKYIPDGDVTDAKYVYAYSVEHLMLQVLKQCGDDCRARTS